MSLQKNDQLIIEKGVYLSLTEIFLGSLLHGFKIPFGGHVLSLNQGAFLAHHVKGTRNRFLAGRSVFEISFVVALMKSLAPTHKRIGPMIAIGMQGFLFSIGTLFGGTSLFGQIISMILLSLWAFIQPLVTYFLIYGVDLVAAFQFYLNNLGVSEDFFKTFILIIISIKVLISILLPIVLKESSLGFLSKYNESLSRYIKVRKSQGNPVTGALKDLLNPFFIISFILMVGFFYIQSSSLETIAWPIFRSLAVAFIIFYCLRSPFVSNLFLRLGEKNRYFKRLYTLAQKVDDQVRENT